MQKSEIEIIVLRSSVLMMNPASEMDQSASLG
ncbi:hypothetical protein F383_25793 [Gossypium arboreum]|uniref:Uncharacterized protein n=1 Tax=Gossypium arboreum TaxID=29729 RepID=A0A0B0P853_GOSAR|nr:hypothetical protein F383_25793 [Gossypium arboreum]